MNVDRAKLRALVERIERLDDEAQALNDDRKEVYAEAKDAQFDVSALKAVISTRRKQRKNPDSFEARQTLVDVYLHALGTDVATRAGAREGIRGGYQPDPGPRPSPPIAGSGVVPDDLSIPDYLRRPA
jgi:uncharacterized protein (UPF0335 family)